MSDWLIIDKIEIESIKKFVISNTDKSNKIDLKSKSTVGNKSKQYNLFNKVKNTFLEKKIKTKIKKLLKTSNSLEILNAWTVIGEKGSYHKLHNHFSNLDKNVICSVIYLEIPKKEDNENGNFYCAYRDKYKQVQYFSHKPEVGDIIVFPSCLLHGVYPQDKGIRRSLNIDFLMI
jgi:hypothetical protein